MARNTKERGQETRTGAKTKEPVKQESSDKSTDEPEGIRRLRKAGIKFGKGPVNPRERNQI